MTILVTGGAGYIGSHILVDLASAGLDFVVFDNLCNSSVSAMKRVEIITGKPIKFVHGDIRNSSALERVFSIYEISSVIHLAALKSVGESVAKPLSYYDNNVFGSQELLRVMQNASVFKIVFSSSATVYGDTAEMPISEQCPVGKPTNPYGRTKLIVEEILYDLTLSDSRWHVAVLRYFNPVGAHPSGLIGEDPKGVPNNLVPFISKVAVGKLEKLIIFGNDYPTPDGTGVRDYIHVSDLSQGHLKALDAIKTRPGHNVWNLGTGLGYSVLDMVHAFEKASGCIIPYRITNRRPGDVARCWSDPTKANRELGWSACRGLDEMMLDNWRWQSRNPNGYLE